MSPHDEPQRCQPMLLAVPRKEIGYFRFILEAYDGLAQLKAEPGRDEVTLLVPPSRLAEAEELLESLCNEIGLKRLDG